MLHRILHRFRCGRSALKVIVRDLQVVLGRDRLRIADPFADHMDRTIFGQSSASSVARVTGVPITDAYVDKGYRGHGHPGETAVHIAGQHRRNTSRSERKRRRRRSAIEPKIGHLKSDHRMRRCFLAGLHGDAINALLSAAGSNLRKLLGLLRCDGRGSYCALIELLTPFQSSLVWRVRRLFEPSGSALLPSG